MKKFFLSPPWLLIVVFALIGSFTAEMKGQSFSLKGTVTDQNGEALPGVNVVEKGTTNGIMTDADGRFSLNVRTEQATLVFSSIGYIKVEVFVKGPKELNVELEEDLQTLDEVVVVGYSTARKRDLTGAISSIKTDKMEREAPRSLQDMMRANAPGLNISLAPGADGTAHMKIRGETTLKAGASPLIVLDGVIYDGGLTEINPNDIQAIDILKDASSAAVYGAKAANGVIMLTTKKGKAGKPQISLNANVGLATVANAPELLDGPGFVAYRRDYEIGRNSDDYLAKYPQMFDDPRTLSNVSQLDWYNYTQTTPVASVTDEQLMRQWLSRLDFKTPEIENYMNGIVTKWDDLVFQTAFMQDYTVSVSGRNDQISYYWSLGYTDREGIKTGQRFRTFRSHLNLESKITDFLSIGINGNFSDRDQSFLTCDWEQMLRIGPYGSNNIDDPESPYRKYPTSDIVPVNPFYDNLYRDRKDVYERFNINMYAIVKLPFDIEYQFNYAPYYSWQEYYNHESSKNETWNHGGKSERRNHKIFSWQLDNILRWKKTFKKVHNAEVTLLQNAEMRKAQETKAFASGYSPSDVLGYHRVQAGTVPTMESNDVYRTGDAMMARIFYSYDDRYMITASVRRDGYSAFGQMNPRATFPALALGWTFSKEKFIAKYTKKWLDYGKLRFSWGSNGNRDIDQYQALSDMVSGAHPYIDQNGNLYVSSQLYVNRMANKALKWERTESWNLGLDFALFNDLISGSFEAYTMDTHDLLVDRALPDILGFNSVATNLGQLKNNGIEASLTVNPIRRENFSWNATGSFALNRRKIIHLYGDMMDVIDEQGNVTGQREADDIENKWFIGQDPDRIWDYKRIGVWQLDEAADASKYGCMPGDFKYKDQNEDGVMNNDDRVFQGYRTPRFTWSLRNEFTFCKDLTLSFMMYSHMGIYGTYDRAANAANYPDRCTDIVQPRWTHDNPINDYARIGSKNIGTYWKDKSFIRLDNITLSYNLPKSLLSGMKVQSARISLNVSNVALLYTNDWFYFDPEQVRYYKDSDGKDNRNIVEPTPRSYNLSVNFTL